MSRFIGGVPPAGYTGSGPVKPPGPRGPIKPKPGTTFEAPWTRYQYVAANLVNQHIRPVDVVPPSQYAQKN
jgi:hypothetical protein